MAETLKVVSYNCSGLNDPKKRNDIFSWLHDTYHPDILLLQETKSRQEDAACWTIELSMETYWLHYHREVDIPARGLAIAFKKSLKLTLHGLYPDIGSQFFCY